MGYTEGDGNVRRQIIITRMAGVTMKSNKSTVKSNKTAQKQAVVMQFPPLDLSKAVPAVMMCLNEDDVRYAERNGFQVKRLF